MQTTLFMPAKCKAGFQPRQDTFAGKLAYVIGFNEKNKEYRKEVSWVGWAVQPTRKQHNRETYKYEDVPDERFEEYGPQEFDNKPTSGFILNKKVGDYKSDWNHRKSYIRVYDPRGWEFEITPENLLFILENVPSTPGKALEGEFIYSWSGKDLVLLPCNSLDFQESKIYNERLVKKVFFKDLKVGRIYQNKEGEQVVYVGKFPFKKNAKFLTQKYTGNYKYVYEINVSKPTAVFVRVSDNKILGIDSVPTEIKVDTEIDVTNLAEITELVIESPLIGEHEDFSFAFEEFDLMKENEGLKIEKNIYHDYCHLKVPSHAFVKRDDGLHLVFIGYGESIVMEPMVTELSEKTLQVTYSKSAYYNTKSSLIPVDILNEPLYQVVGTFNGQNKRIIPTTTYYFYSSGTKENKDLLDKLKEIFKTN